MSKPHIFLVSRANWACACDTLSRQGSDPLQAYQRWLTASIRNAEDALGARAKRTGPAPKPKSPAPTKKAARAPAAPNKPYVPPNPGALPAGRPVTYLESDVRRVHGTVQMKSYSPGADPHMRAAAERAARSEPKLRTISGGDAV